MAATRIAPARQFTPATQILISLPTLEEQEQITQAQLEHVIALRNTVSALKAELDTVETEVRAALEAGISVEPGIHTVSLRELLRRSVSWRSVTERLANRLYGEGKGFSFCEKVLRNTKPNRIVQLLVS